MIKIDPKQLAEILVKESYVAEEDLKKAQEYEKIYKTDFVNYLMKEELITEALLGQAIAEYYKLPFADLILHQPPKEQVLQIPEDVAMKYRVAVFKEDKNSLIIATDSPEEKTLLSGLKGIFKDKKIQLAYAMSDAIDDTFIHYRKTLETRFAKILESEREIAPGIIDEIMQDAFLYRSSDIHFEAQEKEVLIRFRIDGVLHEAARIDKEHYENILNRIKVMAQMRIDEHFNPQDGAIRYQKEGRNLDLRVSIVPTVYGEKTVIRVLSAYVQNFNLTDIGLSENDQEMLSEASKKPFGMILVTGPTGSGKTTTLYALLRNLNRPEVNITTIEDPVEYKLVGINQIQVNPLTDLTFAKGLRSIVRQDPNIILVGEIRDRETAEISVNAALTGHLLLSTFHANDSATSIPRLLDMGVEPFLLASTMEVVIAQRLVRRICNSCRYSKVMDIKEIEKIFPRAKEFFRDKKVTMYQGKGCPSCNNTGFKGRMAIYEIIKVSPEIKDLILKNPSTQDIWRIAKTQGSKTLFEDGIEKVKNGITTLEELLRMASPPNDLKPSKSKK